MNLRQLNKTFLIGVFLLLTAMQCLSFTTVYADWDPTELAEFHPKSSFIILQDAKYVKLKKNIFKALEGSWCSAEKSNMLMDLTAIVKPTLCVEIGVFTGSSVLPVAITLKHLKKGKIYAIDPWSNAEAVKYLDKDDTNYPWWSTVNMQDAFNLYKKMVNSWAIEKYCITLKKTSAEAAAKLNNIDILNIDGNFTEIGTLNDINLYLPKVKSGGYIIVSNFITMINKKLAKGKAFSALLESCDLIADTDNGNTIVFRKL